VAILRRLAARDRHVKVIVNTRNFGHVRSPYHALLQCYGDAVIGMAADLQDPPELIPAFLEKWREGYKVVLGVKAASEESALMFAVRRLGYQVIDRLSEVQQVRNNTGFGLYDRMFVDVLRKLPDPYPYFRGIVAELGFKYATIPYRQPARTRGITKNNLYRLYDLGKGRQGTIARSFHVCAIVCLARRHHKIQLVGARRQSECSAFPIWNQRRVDRSGTPRDARKNLGRIAQCGDRLWRNK